MTKKATYEELEGCVKESAAQLTKANEQLRLEIIKRKQAEAALIKSEQKYRHIFETTGTAMAVIEEDTKISLINSEFEKLSGYSANEVEGRKSFTEFVTKNDLAKMKKYHFQRRINPDEAPKMYEFGFIDRHGNLKYINLTVDMIPETKQSIASLSDITEFKNVENELQDTLKALRRALRGTIQAMVLTIETRDPYTAGHQRSVTDLARSIAKEMGFPRDKIAGIRMAGALHDIGKIAIPAEILTKPGQLSKAEFELIKKHPQTGYNILKPIKFPWPVAQIVLQHHERMDGSGYPQGLSGKDILLEARILGVADVVEAMASHRPYRPALGIDKALAEISINRGKLYDIKVVDACLKVFKENGFNFKI